MQISKLTVINKLVGNKKFVRNKNIIVLMWIKMKLANVFMVDFYLWLILT